MIEEVSVYLMRNYRNFVMYNKCKKWFILITCEALFTVWTCEVDGKSRKEVILKKKIWFYELARQIQLNFVVLQWYDKFIYFFLSFVMMYDNPYIGINYQSRILVALLKSNLVKLFKHFWQIHHVFTLKYCKDCWFLQRH